MADSIFSPVKGPDLVNLLKMYARAHPRTAGLPTVPPQQDATLTAPQTPTDYQAPPQVPSPATSGIGSQVGSMIGGGLNPPTPDWQMPPTLPVQGTPMPSANVIPPSPQMQPPAQAPTIFPDAPTTSPMLSNSPPALGPGSEQNIPIGMQANAVPMGLQPGAYGQQGFNPSFDDPNVRKLARLLKQGQTF